MTVKKVRSFGHDAMYFQTVLKWCYTLINELILLDTINDSIFTLHIYSIISMTVTYLRLYVPIS